MDSRVLSGWNVLTILGNGSEDNLWIHKFQQKSVCCISETTYRRINARAEENTCYLQNKCLNIGLITDAIVFQDVLWMHGWLYQIFTMAEIFFVFNCRFSEKHFKKEHVTQKHHRRVVRKQFRGLEQRNWLYLGINAKRKEKEIKTW